MEVKIKFIGLVILIFSALSMRSQTLIDSFPSPGKEPRGLAWDGEYLWCADAETDSVYRLDSSSGGIVSGFAFAIQNDYGGLTWGDDSTIWIANGSYIYQVNPSTGGIIHSFSCPGG